MRGCCFVAEYVCFHGILSASRSSLRAKLRFFTAALPPAVSFQIAIGFVQVAPSARLISGSARDSIVAQSP